MNDRPLLAVLISISIVIVENVFCASRTVLFGESHPCVQPNTEMFNSITSCVLIISCKFELSLPIFPFIVNSTASVFSGAISKRYFNASNNLLRVCFCHKSFFFLVLSFPTVYHTV